MNVLIKGMEIPENCGVCRFAVDGWCYAYGKPNIDALANDGRTNFCPLVPVPPHGRLIDADALRHRMYHEAFETDSPMQKWDSGCWIRYKMFERMEKTAPTIIPASEEGE